MNKDNEKNRLDLAYQRHLIYLNSILILSTIGIISFIGTFIWSKEYLIQGTLAVAIILISSYFLHDKINNNLKDISEKIKEL